MKLRVLVTGGSKGIGREIIKEFLDNGCEVFTISRTSPNIIHNDLHSIIGDLSVKKFRDSFLSSISNLDINILVNNLGVNKISQFHLVKESDQKEIFDLNLFTAIEVTKVLIPKMLLNNYGRIVNISSIWGVVSREKRSIYSISKSALHGLTRSVAIEYANNNILINTISPGFTKTELTVQTNTEQELTEIVNSIPLKRLAEPNEIAEAVLFLTIRNTYITGQNLIIDGGYTSK